MNYEIVLIEENKIFISQIGPKGCDLAKIFEEIELNFPNKRLICRNAVGYWYEIRYTDLIHKYKRIFSVERYFGEVPDESKITGFPTSTFLIKRKVNKILNDRKFLKKTKNNFKEEK
jgi:hypothetical protein